MNYMLPLWLPGSYVHSAGQNKNFQLFPTKSIIF